MTKIGIGIWRVKPKRVKKNRLMDQTRRMGELEKLWSATFKIEVLRDHPLKHVSLLPGQMTLTSPSAFQSFGDLPILLGRRLR
jgi:hypothetical protein